MCQLCWGPDQDVLLMFQMDYCNVLYMELPLKSIRRRQLLQNAMVWAVHVWSKNCIILYLCCTSCNSCPFALCLIQGADLKSYMAWDQGISGTTSPLPGYFYPIRSGRRGRGRSHQPGCSIRWDLRGKPFLPWTLPCGTFPHGEASPKPHWLSKGPLKHRICQPLGDPVRVELTSWLYDNGIHSMFCCHFVSLF